MNEEEIRIQKVEQHEIMLNSKRHKRATSGRDADQLLPGLGSDEQFTGKLRRANSLPYLDSVNGNDEI